MANIAIDSGHGAAITFGTSAHAFNWLTIEPGERTREPLPTTHLASTAPTYMAGDLQESGEVTLTFQWDPKTTAAPASTTSGTGETITITWPIVTTAGATLIGTGLITRVKFPQLATQTIQTGEMTVKWSGATPAAYTAGT